MTRAPSRKFFSDKLARVLKIALLLFGLGLGLLFAQVFGSAWMDIREYRQGWIAWKGNTQRLQQLAVDPDLGFRFKKNLRYSRFFWKKKGLKEMVHTDSHGFRNAGKKYFLAEVAVVGDSIMEPLFIDEPRSSFRIMERLIQRETLAFAVARWSLSNYNAAIQQKIVPYRGIHTVLLGLYHNDVQNYGSLAGTQQKWRNTLSTRRKHKQEKIPSPTLEFSCLFSLCYFKELMSRWKPAPTCKSTNLRVGKDVLTDIRPRPYSEQQIKDTLRMVALAHHQLQQAASPKRLVVMWIPSQASLYRKEIDSKCPGKGTGVWQKEQTFFLRLQQLARKRKFLLWDSRPMLLAHRKKGEQLFFSQDDDHHFNHLGNRRLGEWMARKLKPLLPPPTPKTPRWVSPIYQRYLSGSKRILKK